MGPQSLLNPRNRVPITIRQERLGICGDCPHNHGGVCSRCGCFLKAKARVATEACPLNKWGTYEKEEQ